MSESHMQRYRQSVVCLVKMRKFNMNNPKHYVIDLRNRIVEST